MKSASADMKLRCAIDSPLIAHERTQLRCLVPGGSGGIFGSVGSVDTKMQS
jgi:hypothetical protein